MCTTDLSTPLDHLRFGLAALLDTDVVGQPDDSVRDELRALLAVANQVQAAIWQRVASFDARDLAQVDGLRTTRAWLTGFAHLGPHVATTLVRHARLIRQLPTVAATAGRGELTGEHLTKIADLVDEVGLHPVRHIDPILAELAANDTPAQLQHACDRVRAHLDPDGPPPDPAHERRGLTLARVGDLVRLRGQLDLEAGATLTTALDALMRPPGPDDDRTPAQRRADALVDLARLPLHAGVLPATGGVRPHLGLLVTPDALTNTAAPRPGTALHRLLRLTDTAADTNRVSDRPVDDPTMPTITVGPARAGAPHRPAEATTPRLNSPRATAASAAATTGLDRDPTHDPAPPPQPSPTAPHDPTPWQRVPPTRWLADQPPRPRQPSPTATARPDAVATDPAHPQAGAPPGAAAADPAHPQAGAPPGAAAADPAHPRAGAARDPLSAAGIAPGPEPPWLTWVGAIPIATAQRLACDSVITRVLYDPATGRPLDVGRVYRTAPPWIRRALHARDRGCRWPGCDAEIPWCDAHHLVPWSEGGRTAVDTMLLLCRFHHTKVHEGQWALSLDHDTGEVSITRPDGTPYELNPSASWLAAPRAA